MACDVIVIGGSFAGLSAALQIARARRRVMVIDAGRPRNRTAHAVHGFFGHENRPPAALIARAREQLLGYPAVTFMDGVAEKAAQEDDGFAVTMQEGKTFRAVRLILATGVADSLPDIPGLAERWGETVLHCPYCHGYEVKGDRLGVLATSPLAVDQANLLRDWGGVTLFGQGEKLEEEDLRKFSGRGGRFESTPVTAVENASAESLSVRLSDGRAVELDALYLAPDFRPAGNLPEQLGLKLVECPHGFAVETDEEKQTSVRGVYAAGDMARLHHNATLAAADGVVAGISAHQSLVA